ncbi:hypothetical protein [Engelhardtia mirabilis]|uniref:Uncharacterized protein n=1 Tax=Engelhardtia mirabilis TaxID=2528011 RepID=A0A518BMU3_9BACT|nr:hypothetical protein Pla133_33970 [Planctomycetes bacterium Pla133]QDV02627.1 hypothetical protein Pla86_33960 [Planctomycetes bacterium Pla86]
MSNPAEQRRRGPAALALVSSATLLAGCYGSAGHAHYIAPPQVETVYEQEPNNTFQTPQGLGALYGGDCLTVLGHSDFFDADGFAFVAGESIEVHVALDGENPFCDLDLCVYDPYLGQYILCKVSPNSDEFASFTVDAGFEFHLVVSSASGASNYALGIEVFDSFGYAPYSAVAGEDEAQGGAGAKVRALDAAPEELQLDSADADRRRAFDRYLDGSRTDASPLRSERGITFDAPLGRFLLSPAGLPPIAGDVGLVALQWKFAAAD